jgi:hypothetical protein
MSTSVPPGQVQVQVVEGLVCLLVFIWMCLCIWLIRSYAPNPRHLFARRMGWLVPPVDSDDLPANISAKNKRRLMRKRNRGLVYVYEMLLVLLGSVAVSLGIVTNEPPPMISGVLLLLLAAIAMNTRPALFAWLAETFDTEQRLQDGALVACMLEQKAIQVDSVYWLHRPDIGYPPPANAEKLQKFDPNINWVRGSVSAIDKDNSTLHVVLEDGVLRQVSYTSSNLQWSDILNAGRAGLMSVTADKITRAVLMQGPSQTAATETGEKGRINVQALARATNPGEVDYFVSHSWHDDAEVKAEQWEIVFNRFREEHGRFPTIWLDEIIINQKNIEGLFPCVSEFCVSGQ